MLYFNLPRLLRQKGIVKPFSYFLSLGYSRTTASKMATNQVISFTVSKLEQYCIEMNCTPNDLFDYHPNSSSNIGGDHPLNELIRDDVTNEINALLHNLPMKKIKELAALINNGEL